MRLTTRVRYGARALVDIALHSQDGPVALREIAIRQDLSQAYLEQLIITLKAAGLVRSVRGARGGFFLARDPREITMGRIVEVLEGQFLVVDCLWHPEQCHRSGECITRGVWHELNQAISDVLEGTTLADLIAQAQNDIRSSD